MAKKMVHTLTVNLPDDFMDAAEVAAKIKPHLDAMTAALKEAGVSYLAETKHMTAKATSSASRAKRGSPTHPLPSHPLP